ncbi:MAG: hypothetical protein DCF25_21185 [Leptolyngbya foveolarum]|uniref:Uncharacterized protein n=1 Tax=Leptolyngbya foveolarum TaxID=47253 RepID=A0A2W4VK30_9CYAN|nr:MAG: hypothetical protein DCF25_21185 [Leptolyngbya foveolarum]
MESCVEYWESQGIDPFEAIAAVGCKSDMATSTGHDVVGGGIFLALILVGMWIASRTQDTESSEYDIFR